MRIGDVEIRDVGRALAGFVRETRSIINGGLTFRDNFAGVVHTFKWSKTGGPVLLRWPLSRPPAGVLCLSVRIARGDLALAASNLPIDWRYSQDGILITSIGTVSAEELLVTVAVVEG